MKQIQRLLTPGPAPVPNEVLELLALPMEHHRTKNFIQVFKEIKTDLKELFQTSGEACVLTATGSGAMESAVVNFFSKSDEVLVVVSGKFGERWAEMCEVFGLKTHRLNIEWGKSVKTDQIKDFLKKNSSIKGVFCQYCETSTGALHPIREMGPIVRSAGALMIVDAITALGAMPLPLDEWQVDVAVGGSQKALMLPTGLSFIGIGPRALAKIATSNLPKFYFDLQKEIQANAKSETYFSSSVSLLRPLHWVLKNKFVGAKASSVHSRVAKLQRATSAGVKALGLKLYPENPSPSLSVVELSSSTDGQKLRDVIEQKHGVILMGGQDQLKGRVLRIGHMGFITDDDLMTTFKAIALELDSMNVDSVLKAVQSELNK